MFWDVEVKSGKERCQRKGSRGNWGKGDIRDMDVGDVGKGRTYRGVR